MKRLAAVLAVAASFALAGPAQAWPPFCKPAVVYDLTGICL
ncbi:MAG TPA: hypothetical protein VNA20_10730 [Frankiaceae bacterium]|nr:hypothetical protein [Frankiaceae bacterium]